jgi:hypothetical protein
MSYFYQSDDKTGLTPDAKIGLTSVLMACIKSYEI